MPSGSDYTFAGFNAGTINDTSYEQTLNNMLVSGYQQDVVKDWAFPQRKEERQMAEQLMMDRLEPSSKMEGMRRAGINPLTAASGIAGINSSTPQPASSVNPIGDIAGAVGAVAQGFNSIAGGVSTFGKLGSEIDNINSSTKKNFADIGLTAAQTEGVMTDNKYRDDDWLASLNVKRQQFDNMKAEYANILKTHEEIEKHIQEMQSQIELNGSQADYLDSFKLKLDEETRWIKAKNDFCIAHNLFLLQSGLDGYIFSMVESGADLSQFDKFIEVYSDYRQRVGYASTKGVRNAEVDTAFEKAFNEALGNADVQAMYAPYMERLNVVKDALISMNREIIKSPSNLRGTITKLLNAFYQLGLSLGLDEEELTNSLHAPDVSPKKSK